MGNKSGKASRRQRQDHDDTVIDLRSERRARQAAPHSTGRTTKGHIPAPLVCRTPAQSRYLQQMQALPLVFGLGPAGTGKSHVALIHAAMQYDAGRIHQIIVTRPNVEAGPSMGYLPGTDQEKCAPWFAPMLKILNRHFGTGRVECMLKNKQLEFVPLGHVRGHTYDSAIVIVDEAQNTTVEQMKAILTRIGHHSQLLVDGDLSQIDIKGPSGLADALAILSEEPFVGITEFTEDDIVRSDLVKSILIAYRNKKKAA